MLAVAVVVAFEDAGAVGDDDEVAGSSPCCSCCSSLLPRRLLASAGLFEMLSDRRSEACEEVRLLGVVGGLGCGERSCSDRRAVLASLSARKLAGGGSEGCCDGDDLLMRRRPFAFFFPLFLLFYSVRVCAYSLTSFFTTTVCMSVYVYACRSAYGAGGIY